jgi:hypothetical protein
MNERELKLEFRLAAIEHMLANLYKMVYLISGATPQMIADSLDEFQKSVAAEQIPGLDAVQSDLVSAELELAYKHLLDAIRETAGALKRPTS